MLSLRGCVGFLRLWQAGAALRLQCPGFSLRWLLLLWSRGSRLHRLLSLRHMGSGLWLCRLWCPGSVAVVCLELSC